MATMPAPSPTGQPDAATADWFCSAAGQAILDSESDVLLAGLGERRGLPWLWLAPHDGREPARADGRGLRLIAGKDRWIGDVRCALPFPLASESIGVIALQHVLTRDAAGQALLEECARILVPGGRLVLFALNPLAPYRWRWRGAGLKSSEPLLWRRRLRLAGLEPEPLSQGIGPSWRETPAPQPQQGAGLRAAFLLRAEKRVIPLTPVRQRRRVPSVEGLPAIRAARTAVRD
jgi:SAM-dependent methyltransferase